MFVSIGQLGHCRKLSQISPRPFHSCWDFLVPTFSLWSSVTAAMLASFIVHGAECHGGSVQSTELLGLVGMPSPMQCLTEGL